MLRVWYAPRTRAVRVVWLLEELGLPYELERVEFKPPTGGFFSQDTPMGKLPVLEDGPVVMAESGAILEYIVERYGRGELAPSVGAPLRGPYLQWVHYAEGTAYPPIGTIVWHSLYKQDAAEVPGVIEDARGRAHSALAFVEAALEGQSYLLGEVFSAADIMMGFTGVAARTLGVLDERYPNWNVYLDRLLARPALQKAMDA